MVPIKRPYGENFREKELLGKSAIRDWQGPRKGGDSAEKNQECQGVERKESLQRL